MLKKIIFSLALLGCIQFGYGQVPGTWTYNPNAFNYSMTVTTYIDQDCNELNDAGNAVAAFFGGQCRGYAYTNVDGNGKKYAFLTVYSNQASGENIQIRFFNATSGMEITALDGVSFLSNSTVGNISDPFVTTTNHRPTAVNVDNLVVQENTPIGGYIGTISGTDIDGFQTLTYSLPSGSLDNGSFQVTADDLELNTVLNYALQNVYNISIEVNDGQGCTFLDTLQVLVDDNAFPPVAVNDTLSVNEDDTLSAFVLINDSDYDNDIDTTSLQVTTAPLHGTTSVLNGVITYIPDANYFGPDTLVYSICDYTNTGALCDTALVYIDVISVPDPPVAYNDTVSTPEETLISIAILANDTDVENDIDPQSVLIIGGPNHGTTDVTNGVIDYTPNTSYVGLDTIVYQVCDLSVPTSLCDTAVVIINVTQVPDAPEDIVIDTLSILEDNDLFTLVSHIYTADTDLPNDSFTYELVSGNNDSDNGQFSIDGNELIINTKTIYEIKNVYHIRVRSTDSYGLSIEKTFNINVIDIEGNEIPLPASTYISNNSDGKNDFFSIENVFIYDEFSLSVFDQFGKEIYYVPAYYNNEFDGKINGEPLPSGAYYYVFKSPTVTYKGNITIVN